MSNLETSTKLDPQSSVRDDTDIFSHAHAKKISLHIHSKEATGGCALPEGATKAWKLKTPIQETGYPQGERQREFQPEMKDKFMMTAVQQAQR